MWKFLIKVVILAAVILGLAHVLPGLYVPNFPEALLFALILAILNSFITPILIIISFPLTVLTIGFFALLVNAFVFWIASLISYGVYVTTFWGAFWGSLIVALTSFLLNELLHRHPRRKRPPED